MIEHPICALIKCRRLMFKAVVLSLCCVCDLSEQRKTNGSYCLVITFYILSFGTPKQVVNLKGDWHISFMGKITGHYSFPQHLPKHCVLFWSVSENEPTTSSIACPHPPPPPALPMKTSLGHLTRIVCALPTHPLRKKTSHGQLRLYLGLRFG